MRKARTGKFEIPLYHHGLQDFEQHLDRSSNRIALALVALGFIHFIDSMVTDIQDGGRTVVTKEGVFKNDALFLGIGPAFLKDDIPGTNTGLGFTEMPRP